MKISWKFVGACGEGQRFVLGGVDVWSREWIAEKDVPHAEVKDPRYGQAFSFRVYHIESEGRKTRFAAGEFSNSVFGFYVPKLKWWSRFTAISGAAGNPSFENSKPVAIAKGPDGPWLISNYQRKNMRPIVKKALAVVAVYLCFWGLTWWYAPNALQDQIYDEAVSDWREYRRQREERSKDSSSPLDLLVYEHGPVARVELLVCPAPFIMKADCGRSIGGLNGYGWIGWYLVTPWRIYQIARSPTWVS